jgi:hypothetical protein
VIAAEGELIWAAQIWGAASSLQQDIGVQLLPHERADFESAIAATRAQVGEEAFALAWSQGSKMTTDQAIAAQGLLLDSDQM